MPSLLLNFDIVLEKKHNFSVCTYNTFGFNLSIDITCVKVVGGRGVGTDGVLQ